jgi:glycosyltransferase involved in cell wall biosynthesis
MNINIINDYLIKFNISLRQIIYLNNNLDYMIDRDKLIKIIEDNINDEKVKSILIDIINKSNKSNNLNIYDDFLKYIEHENAFVFIVPSYNNKLIYTKNLDSIFDQQYPHFRIIYIDDLSELDEVSLVNDYIKSKNNQNRTILLSQYIRQRQCAGRYIGYHMAYDDEIVIMLDGDDWLIDSMVLNKLNTFYRVNKIMLSYGSYYDFFDGKIMNTLIAYHDFPEDIIKSKGYRKYRFLTGHLRTGYAKLFKSIKLEDLLYSDKTFLHLGTDYAEMMPALEMADTLHRNIKTPLCIYNKDNSYKYTTSYGRVNEPDCAFYKTYRLEIGKILINNPPYDTLDYEKIFESRNKTDTLKDKNKYLIINHQFCYDETEIDQMIKILDLYQGDSIYKAIHDVDLILDTDIYLTGISINHKICFYPKIICRYTYIDNRKNMIIKNDLANNKDKIYQLIIF